MKKDINVLIVDDSKVSTELLRSILTSEPDIKVIGCAKDGKNALELVKKLKPDLITMDVYMPIMDGVEATKAIMSECPTPIIIISSHVNDEESKYVLQALEEGALSIVEKPGGIKDEHFSFSKREIIHLVRALSQVHVMRRYHYAKNSDESLQITASHKEIKLVALGASTGGPIALNVILSTLSADFPVPIVITQHIMAGFLSGLVQWLQKSCLLKIEIAKDRQILEAGCVYFAPDHYHLTIERGEHPIALLDDSPPMGHIKPAANALFTSIAKHYPNAAVGGLLTGMGQDGANGLLSMRNSGCDTFAQSDKTSIVYGMPGAAVALKAVQHIIDLQNISHFLTILLVKE